MGTLNEYLAGGIRRYRVTGPVVVAKLLTGPVAESYLYRGALLPPNADPEQIQLLIESGLIREIHLGGA